MAGLIPQAFIDDLLDKTSLVDLISQHVTLKKRGNSFTACCPFHNEKSPSFNVSELKQVYHCFGCGASGNAISFIMAYQHLAFLDALEVLAEMHNLTLPRDETQVKQRQVNKSHYQLLEEVSLYYQQLLKRTPLAIDYLKQRGLSGETAARYQLGYAAAERNALLRQFPSQRAGLIETGMLIQKDDGTTYDRYRGRVMFPIHDKRGRIVGFGGRVLEKEAKPKYLNSPETPLFHKSRELYGLYQALTQPLDSVVIVEGYMDVIALAEKGVTNAVATLGTATSKEHIQALARHTKQIYFCFDGDSAGKQAAWRALEQSFAKLDDTLGLKFMFLPEGEDPDSLVNSEGAQAFMQRTQRAVDIIDFFLSELRSELDLHTPAGRSQLVAKASPLVQTLPAGTYREIVLDKLTLMTRIDRSRLEGVFEKKNTQLTSEKTKQVKQKNQRYTAPSAIRRTLALLIQQPKLYFQLEKPIDSSILCGDGVDLLKNLLEVIHANSTTAQILEHFRDSALFQVIQNLSHLELHIPPDGALAELAGSIVALERSGQQIKIQQLLQKANQDGLSDNERHELQRMIKSMKNCTTTSQAPQTS